MDDILNASVNDPRGEGLLTDLVSQDLSALSVADLDKRIESLREEIARCEKAREKREGANAAAEALFKS